MIKKHFASISYCTWFLYRFLGVFAWAFENEFLKTKAFILSSVDLQFKLIFKFAKAPVGISFFFVSQAERITLYK